MDSYPLYVDSDQLTKLATSKSVNQANREKWIESVLHDYETHRQKDFFKKIDPAIEYVDAFGDAIIHVDTWFAMMDFIRTGRDPGTEMREAKAIRFEYNTLDIYDYSDNYFKKHKVRIPMCLQFQHLCQGESRAAKIITYSILWNIFQKSKLISLEVLGRLQKRYEFYKIDPVYVSINRDETIPL